MYRGLADNQKLIVQAGDALGTFYVNLNKAMLAIFWMYVVYSFNYWGLSQYYWYLFAGAVVVFNRLTRLNLVVPETSEATPVQTLRKNRFSNLVDLSGRR